MYYLFIKAGTEWSEWGKSESFASVADAARGVSSDREVKIVGPEGEWHRAVGERFVFTPTDAEAAKKKARRERANANRRGRDTAMRSVGMKKTPYGWE